MKDKVYKIFKLYIIHYEGIGWLRWGNKYGIAWKNLNKHKLYFSERNGYTKTYRVFNYSFKILKPNEG